MATVTVRLDKYRGRLRACLWIRDQLLICWLLEDDKGRKAVHTTIPIRIRPIIYDMKISDRRRFFRFLATGKPGDIIKIRVKPSLAYI